MGNKRNVDMTTTTDTVKIVEVETDIKTAAGVKSPRRQRSRGRQYQLVRSQVDKTKTYDPFAAVELVKRLSYSRFDGTIEIHGVVRDEGENLEVTFPHSTGKTVKVVVVSDEILAQLESGVIDFDVLLSTKEFMPKLTKYAKLLGPKGLMPNPKTGTLTEHPDRKKAELEGGKTVIKSEKKAPLFHTTLGKVSTDTKILVENLQALIKALKGRLLKLTICASMSPGIKVAVE